MNDESSWLRFNKNIKYVFFDVETFSLNLNFQINRPWECACLKVIGENIVEEIDKFIKWPDCKFKIGDGAAKATKFDQKEFDSKSILPKEAFPPIWEALKWCDKIICHNFLRFDAYLLKGYAEYMGEDWRFVMDKIIDTKAVAQGIKLGRPFHPQTDDWLEYQYTYANDFTKGIKTNLTALGKEFQIPFDYDSLHRAINDTKLNLLVWNRLKWQLEL